MTIDLFSAYETIDSLQLRGDYSELRQIAEYASAAIRNDGRRVKVKSYVYRRRNVKRLLCKC